MLFILFTEIPLLPGGLTPQPLHSLAGERFIAYEQLVGTPRNNVSPLGFLTDHKTVVLNRGAQRRT